MNASEIFKMAQLFEQQVKEASIRGNMAKRILFSLLSHLVPAGESARISYTRGAVDYNALKQMIPGAKEILEYGTRAALQEAKFLGFPQTQFDPNNIDQILQQLTDFFNGKGQVALMGGKNWGRITMTLQAIKHHLDAAMVAKKRPGWDEEYIDQLMQMTAYVNVLDGLAHNTGSFIDKAVILEREDATGNALWQGEPGAKGPTYPNQHDIERLMDAKELSDPDEVLQEILPTLEHETDAQLTMKEWMSAARRKKHEYTGSHEEREERLRRIRLKKRLIQFLDSQGIPELKATMDSWKNLADNRLLKNILDHKSVFQNLIYAGKDMLRIKEVPEDIKDRIKARMEFVRFLQSPDLADQELHKVTKAFWEAFYLISELERAAHSVG